MITREYTGNYWNDNDDDDDDNNGEKLDDDGATAGVEGGAKRKWKRRTISCDKDN